MTDTSYFALQEHFRKSKTTDKLFSNEFSDYNSYVIPGYRPPNQFSGRPKADLHCLAVKVSM